MGFSVADGSGGSWICFSLSMLALFNLSPLVLPKAASLWPTPERFIPRVMTIAVNISIPAFPIGLQQ
jgi:hypothetical protein